MSQQIVITDSDHIRTIRMNRPEMKNALTHEMYAAMAGAINSAQADKSVRVVSITGTGDAFTSGNDIQEFIESKSNPPYGDEVRPVELFLKAILDAKKPLVSVVNGVAVGVGATMLLHCDFVFAGRSAKISAPFVDLGVVPEAASSLLLPMIVGPRKAAEMFMLGTRVGAEEAQACGLITRMFEDDTLQAESEEILKILAAKAPSAILNAKALLKKNRAEAAGRMQEEGKIFADALRGPEFAEAASAFLQKRAPNFDNIG